MLSPEADAFGTVVLGKALVQQKFTFSKTKGTKITKK